MTGGWRSPNFSKEGKPLCSTGDCTGVNYCIGLCRWHYQRDLIQNPRKAVAECGVSGCGLSSGRRGLCSGHYKTSWKYSLSPERIATLINSNNGVCPICKNPTSDERLTANYGWSIDHDHSCCPSGRSCGKCVRGAICANCNIMLGMSADSAETLRAAADYLDGWTK